MEIIKVSDVDKNQTIDVTCLAEGCIYPKDQEYTGINSNEIIIGPTRCGKTMSVVEPKLLHTYNSSLIVSLTKRVLVDKYAEVFRARGYEVLDLNLAEPSKSNITYDPMDFVGNSREIVKFANNLVLSADGGSGLKDDKYWDDSATSVLAAIIGLSCVNAMDEGRKPSFRDFYNLYNAFKIDFNGSDARSSIDFLFVELEERHPGNQYSRMWKTIQGISTKTASCIYSIVNNAVDKIMTEEFLEMIQGDRRLSFEELANKKTILFVTTSPVNKAMQKLSNLFFTDAFRKLFEYAEELPGGELPIPVHLVCDDFATGSKIPDFHEYISIFCAKRISCTLLLQSESQLQGLYTENQATTIINNCDTYLYMGGMDNTTCRNISQRLNVPFEDVISMPLEKVVVFRRGAKPVIARRYQTTTDPLYEQLQREHQNKEKQKKDMDCFVA